MSVAGEIKVHCSHSGLVHISELKPNPKNPNKHPENQIELLANIIEKQGWRQPIKVSTLSGFIVSGHGRYEAALFMGSEYVPVDYQDYENEEQELADLLADNRIAELAEMDEKLLAELFSELDLDNIEVELTGYTKEEIEEIVLDVEESRIDIEQADDILPEVTEKPVTIEGDIWNIGKHRLVCGDSTKQSTYAMLMQGEFADLVITDPPYNVAYEGAAGSIMNDDMDSSSFREFLRDVYNGIAAVTRNGAGIYVFHADSEGINFRTEFEKAGFLLKQCLVWVKNSFVLGRQDYQWRHEPCLYGWKSGDSHYFTENRSLSTVIELGNRPDFSKMQKEEIVEFMELLYDEFDSFKGSVLYCDKPTKSDLHPTMKPVKLIAELVENSSKYNWVVLDSFGGSGSTLIACESLNRKARLIELDTKFCDVIVKRYISVTGKKDITLIRDGVEIQLEETGII